MLRTLKNIKTITKITNNNKIADNYIKTVTIDNFKILKVNINDHKNISGKILENEAYYYDGDDFSNKERTENCFK